MKLTTLLRCEVRDLYSQFAQRLAMVEKVSDSVGWDFHDSIADVVGSLEDELSGS